MNDAFVRIDNLCKHYGYGDAKVEVLRNITTSIGQGEVCVLLGPSGSGKSTFLNLVGGLEPADGGTIAIGDTQLTALRDHDLVEYRRRQLGFVFQFYNLVSDLIDVEDNQGVGYALDDVQGDQTMWTVLLFLLVVIMGFVFVVLTGATIEQESAVIGTLLASGWRKRELVRHYLFLPAIIGFVATCIGLVIGVGALCDPFKNLYYHSYSLPPYHTIWNWNIVVLTAVVPYLLLVGITLVGLARSLRFTPLQFLRHEASGKRRGGRIRLSERLRYVTRFRLRVLMRNASHFVTLFFGIMFAKTTRSW